MSREEKIAKLHMIVEHMKKIKTILNEINYHLEGMPTIKDRIHLENCFRDDSMG